MHTLLMVRHSAAAVGNYSKATYRIREKKRAMAVRREMIGNGNFHSAQKGKRASTASERKFRTATAIIKEGSEGQFEEDISQGDGR
jgi:hypothetical protein